jgi:hypothetical protein
MEIRDTPIVAKSLARPADPDDEDDRNPREMLSGSWMRQKNADLLLEKFRDCRSALQ